MFFAEIFAADRCAALINNKVFAECHSYISPEAYRAVRTFTRTNQTVDMNGI